MENNSLATKLILILKVIKNLIKTKIKHIINKKNTDKNILIIGN
jgi:hypothetical protein